MPGGRPATVSMSSWTTTDCSTSKSAAQATDDHSTLKDVADILAQRRQHRFDELDFEISPVMSLGGAQCYT